MRNGLLSITAILLVSGVLPAQWEPVDTAAVTVVADGPNQWKIVSSTPDEFAVESTLSLPAAPGQAFEIALRRRVDLNTRVAPELACFDAQGRRIPNPHALPPDAGTTSWQTFTRVFPVLPGTATVRARIRAEGRGEFRVADLVLRNVSPDPYRTGRLITQIHPFRRRGLVLESDHGIVNRHLLSTDDADRDGKWALLSVDLDRLMAPEEKGEDWRTNFRYRPSEIYWSEGVFLKSDSILENRPPSFEKALHFRLRAHRGPYRAILNDPGRAVAVSTDGKTWKRFEGGAEAELGILEAADEHIELWLDACYRDPISAGPVYFDYVRLFPADHAPSVDRLFNAARRTPPRLARGSVDRKRVPVTVEAPAFEHGANWPVRAGLPIPQGELADAQNARVTDAAGRALASQNRALATWPDGSVKWLYLDFTHDFSKSAKQAYAIEYGNAVRALAPRGSVKVETTPEGLRVDTGALRFLVSRRRFGLVERDEPMPIEIAETSGRVWRALDVPVEKLSVEQAGPLHTVILAETRLPASGKPAEGFYHRARIHAFAGSPLVQVDYFVANTDSRAQVQVKSIALALPAGVQLGVEAFEEQGPKSLRREGGRLILNLWNGSKETYEWVQGVGKTHKLSLFFGPASGDTRLLAHGPVLALAEPSWYAASGAFGPQLTAGESGLPEVEKTLAAHMDEAVIRNVGLGFENYGDHSSGGYVKGTWLWDNNEYDMPAAAMVHFVRTGDRDALRIGLASALHYLDVDTIHYNARRAEWAGAQRVHSHGTYGHHTAAGPDMQHAGYVKGLIWYTYFTGEPIGILGARGIAEWALGRINPNQNVGYMERTVGHPLMTLNDLYEATWDPRYLKGSARLVDWALKWEHPVRSGFLSPPIETPGYYSGVPFNGGLLASAILQFNGWARLPEIDETLERASRWVLTDVWQPGGRIANKGGRPQGGMPQHIATHMRLMHYQYERTKDPLFLAVPFDSMMSGYGAGGKIPGTRSTGLVFNYLPWFFTTLKNAGHPRPGKELILTPASPLEMRKGAKARACVVMRNESSAPLTNMRGSFQPRLDFAVVSRGAFPETLAPGRQAEVCVELQAPAQIGLTSEFNRQSYAHWSFVFTRGESAGFAYATTGIRLKE